MTNVGISLLILAIGLFALFTAWRLGYEEGKQAARKTISAGEPTNQGTARTKSHIYTCIHGVPLYSASALCLRITEGDDA